MHPAADIRVRSTVNDASCTGVDRRTLSGPEQPPPGQGVRAEGYLTGGAYVRRSPRVSIAKHPGTDPEKLTMTGGDVRLPILPAWLAQRRYSFIGLGAMILVAIFVTVDVAIDPSDWPILSVLAIIGAFLFVYDAVWTEQLRFGSRGQPYLLATECGLSGEVFPSKRYKHRSDSFIIRSLLFRRVIATVDRPNFVPWDRTAFGIRRRSDEMSVAFLDSFSQATTFSGRLSAVWLQPMSRKNSVVSGVFCSVPRDEVVTLVYRALAGGSDVHVQSDLLTEAGVEARIPCFEHDGDPSRRGGGYPRLRRPTSPSECASWFGLDWARVAAT
jgi:nitrate reductase NapE component